MALVAIMVIALILSAIGTAIADIIEGIFDFLGPIFGFVLLIFLLGAVCSYLGGLS